MADTPSLTPGFFAFLGDLKAHNDREWFQANRERYDADVRDPFLRLLAALAPRLRAIAPEFLVDPRPVARPRSPAGRPVEPLGVSGPVDRRPVSLADPAQAFGHRFDRRG